MQLQPGFAVGYRVEGRYRRSIVLRVGIAGVWVTDDDRMLGWDEVLTPF